MVELAEDKRHEDVAGGDGGLGVGLLDGLKASEGAFVVEVVEVLVSLADLGGDPFTGRGVVGVGKGRTREQENEEEAQIFDAAYYRDSPRPDVVRVR
jgi:hypothetical protein